MKFTISGLDTNENFATIGQARNMREARSIACQYVNKGYTDITIENIKTGYIRRHNPMTVDTYTPVVKIDC